MLVVPAIDLLHGQAVRLHQGRYDQVTVYDADPAARARSFRGKAPRLHVVDLEGAKAGHAVQADAVRAIVAAFGPGVQIGGGVRTRAALESYLALGVERVVLGTAAVEHTELVLELVRAHPGVSLVAVDAKDGWVATSGWTEVSTVTAIDLARRFAAAPIAGVLYTDVARDGTKSGPNVEMTARLARDAGVSVIASGGVGTLDHLRALAAHPGIDAAIVGRALYDSVFTLENAIAAAGPAPLGQNP
jgi:phosphoribosylformimino-5-aminoimidazole carboxamide ribotide isomerase